MQKQLPTAIRIFNVRTAVELYLFRAADQRINELAQRANAALGATPGAFVQEMMEQTGLTRDEVSALNAEQIAWWSYRVQVVAYVDELPPEDRLEFDASTRAFYSVPYALRWLEATKSRLNPNAVRYIENLLAQPG